MTRIKNARAEAQRWSREAEIRCAAELRSYDEVKP